MAVFYRELVEPTKFVLKKCNDQVLAFLYGDYKTFKEFRVKTRPKKLGVAERIMRFLLVSRNINNKLIEYLFGVAGSAAYSDAWLIVRVFLEIFGDKIKLPHKDSDEYKALRGVGVFEGAFPSAVYVMDGHEVCVCFFCLFCL